MSGAAVHHRLRVEAELGALRLEARLEFAAAWTVIFGPSGSGKSSLLRAMCGLLEAGRVEFASCRAGVDGAGGSVAVHQRGLGYAPQGGAIFPHMTVRENVAFAVKSRRGAGGSQRIVEEAMDLFGLSALAARRPRDLSGGERQRVNLARAFAVSGPRLMLLDEPFTGIDRATRDALLPPMREQMAAAWVPVISVTHDVEEALLLGAEVVRVVAGRVVAKGAAMEVLAEERELMLRVLQPRRDEEADSLRE